MIVSYKARLHRTNVIGTALLFGLSGFKKYVRSSYVKSVSLCLAFRIFCVSDFPSHRASCIPHFKLWLRSILDVTRTGPKANKPTWSHKFTSLLNKTNKNGSVWKDCWQWSALLFGIRYVFCWLLTFLRGRSTKHMTCMWHVCIIYFHVCGSCNMHAIADAFLWKCSGRRLPADAECMNRLRWILRWEMWSPFTPLVCLHTSQGNT